MNKNLPTGFLEHEFTPPKGAARLDSAARNVSMTAAERQCLLREIGAIALLLADPQTFDEAREPLPLTPTVSDYSTAPHVSPLEQWHLLNALWPGLKRAFQTLLQQPDVHLSLSAVPTAVDRARGNLSLVTALARTPQGAQVWAQFQRRQAQHTRPSPLFPDARSCPDEQTQARRFAVHVACVLQRETCTLAQLAAFQGENEIAERAHEMAHEAIRWQQHPALAGFDRGLSNALSPATLARQAAGWPAPHRRLLHLWLQWLRPLAFDWSASPLLRVIPLADWHVYECWCFLKVAHALLRLGWRVQFSTLLRWRQNRLRFVMATGQDSRLVFTHVARDESLFLTYQPLYISANRAAGSSHEGRFRSRSHAMQPDIALQWGDELYLLDPKFRAYHLPQAYDALSPSSTDTALLDDLDKMHTYRDAIVRSSSANQNSAVRQAWCLFPGDGSDTQRIIAFPHSTPEQPFGAADVGALCLRPGTESPLLGRLLQTWLHG